jgi:hypothetical protein
MIDQAVEQFSAYDNCFRHRALSLPALKLLLSIWEYDIKQPALGFIETFRTVSS